MNATVRVHLLGRDYLLRSQGDPEQVQAAAALVEEKLAGLSDKVSVDTRDRFMLAMLNLAGEYLQIETQNLEMTTELDELKNHLTVADRQCTARADRLIERIEDALDF